MYVGGFRALYRFPGYTVKKARMDDTIAEVTLRRDKRCVLHCPYCEGRLSPSREEYRAVRDLPLGPARYVLLRYPVIQGRCRHCRRYATVHPPGMGAYQQATQRLMQYASHLCSLMPVSHVADLFGVSDAAVRRWDKRILTATLGEPNLDDLEVLLIDEKSIGTSHPFTTVVLNGLTGELLHMKAGTKPEGIESFMEKLTDEQKASIKAVGMDRDGAYRRAVEAHLNAEIIYDKFHVIQNYNKVIDDVRRSEWRKAKAEDKPVIKGLRYILLKRPERRTAEDWARLEDVVAINERISLVELLKDDLRQLWSYRYRAWAKRWLDGWIDWALSTGIEPLTRFARGLRRDAEYVLNYCKYRVTSGRIEGFNNIISRTIHRACGVQDLDYLFLKLRQESL